MASFQIAPTHYLNQKKCIAEYINNGKANIVTADGLAMTYDQASAYTMMTTIYIQPEQHCQSENNLQTVTTLWAKWGFWNKIYWENSFRITQIIASVKAACCSLVIVLDNSGQKLVYCWLSARL